jgi:hypothetical protein
VDEISRGGGRARHGCRTRCGQAARVFIWGGTMPAHCCLLGGGTPEAVTNALLNPAATVRIWAAPNRIVVHVHDNGPGPPDPLAGLIPPPPAVPQTRNLGYGSPTSSTSTLPSSTATTASPSGSAAARSPADRYGSVTHQVEPADPQGPARRWPGQVMLSGHDGVVIHADVVDRDAGDGP